MWKKLIDNPLQNNLRPAYELEQISAFMGGLKADFIQFSSAIENLGGEGLGTRLYLHSMLRLP